MYGSLKTNVLEFKEKERRLMAGVQILDCI